MTLTQVTKMDEGVVLHPEQCEGMVPIIASLDGTPEVGFGWPLCKWPRAVACLNCGAHMVRAQDRAQWECACGQRVADEDIASGTLASRYIYRWPSYDQQFQVVTA